MQMQPVVSFIRLLFHSPFFSTSSLSLSLSIPYAISSIVKVLLIQHLIAQK